MFGKKKCSRCDRKVNKSFDFCPHCASPLKAKEDYGVLGRSDDVKELDSFFKNSFANSAASNSAFGNLFSGVFKMLEQEIQRTASQQENIKKNLKQNPRANFELFINGSKVNLPGNIAGIEVEEIPGRSSKAPKQPKAKMPRVSEETLKSSIKLPRKEAKTKLTRTSERVIYELDTPGIQSLNQVMINQLESAIEVRAYTKEAVFNKTISVNLPLLQYTIKPVEGKLILEFKAG